MIRPLRWGLAPLAGLYWAVTSFRNHLYTIGYTPSLSFDPLIISVGNLSVGGTGKSPMIEYLVRMLCQEHSLAILSRGYKRKTHGVRIASEQDNADTLGDEPYQFYRKFGQASFDQATVAKRKVVVAVGEERALAIPEILHHHPEVSIILLDDAFQHRKVKADLQILLSTYQRPFYHDHILPLGLLRESRKGAERADVVVITKCPEETTEEQMNKMRVAVQAYAGKDVPVFFATIDYRAPEPVFAQKVKDQKHSLPESLLREPVLLFSGIAHADLFEAYVRRQFSVVEHIRWEDHHRYTESDVKKVQEAMKKKRAGSVLTTEKDMVKLIEASQSALWKDIPLYYLPIQVKFLAGKMDFQQYIIREIRSAEKE